MASLNKVMLIGNAGRDAEMRYTANGTAQAKFSLAVNWRRRAQSGDWEEQTEWFNIVMFGDRAERMSQYVTKGKSLYIEGRLQTRTWDDDQGVRHYLTEVIANDVRFLDRRESGGGDGTGSGDAWGEPAAGARTYSGGAGGDIEPDDLPFE
jgi:single-strand DNA-binding protein